MLNDSIKLFIARPIIGLPNALLSLIASILAYFFIDLSPFANTDFSANATFESLPADIARSLSMLLLFIILSLLVQPLLQAITALLCMDAINNRKIKFSETLKQSTKYYFRLLGVTFFKLVIIVIIAIVFIIMLSVFLTVSNSSPSSIVISSLFILFFSLLLFSFFVILIPIEPLLVLRDLSLGDAIQNGLRFGLKKFFPLLGVLLLVILTGIVINLTITLTINDNQIITSMITSFLGTFPILYVLFMFTQEMNPNPEALPNTNINQTLQINSTQSEVDANANQNNLPPAEKEPDDNSGKFII